MVENKKAYLSILFFMKERPSVIKKAYLYISRNQHALRERLEEIKNYVISDKDTSTELKEFDTGDTLSLEDFEGFVSSASLFSERKIAVLENIENAPASFQKKAAEKVSEDGGADIVFIFTSSNERINRSLLEKVKEVGTIRKIKPPVAGDLMNWLENKARDDGISFTDDAKFLLVDNVNLDMKLLKNEYKKLEDYISSEDKKTIDKDTVKFLVSRVYSLKIFDLVDFLGERDKNRSLEALEDILNEDKNLLGLITLIHRMFKSMLYIKNDEGKSSVTGYLSRNINMPPYFIGKMVNKYIRYSKNYSEAEIIRIINILNDYDIGLRRSIVDNSKIIKTMIAQIVDVKV